jgi:hypothetical protein
MSKGDNVHRLVLTEYCDFMIIAYKHHLDFLCLKLSVCRQKSLDPELLWALNNGAGY